MFAIFSLIFFKVISLLLSVIIGFIAGKYKDVQRESITLLLFYFIAPIVFFSIPANSVLTINAISIIITMFILASILCFISYKIFSRYMEGETKNFLAMSAGTGNVGYFMLPIASTLFDDYTLSIYMMAVIGINVYEASIGFYICARSFSSTKESILRVLKMPILHAFILGSTFSLFGANLPEFLDDFVYNMKATYSVLGMVMVGLSISKLEKFEIDMQFTLFSLFSKFILYPIIINIFILMDQVIFHWYTTSHYNALRLLSTAPIAGNTIVIASIMRFSVEKAATAVLLSCICALIYIPLIASIFLNDI